MKIAEAIGKSHGSASMVLVDLHNRGKVRRVSRGVYSWIAVP